MSSNDPTDIEGIRVFHQTDKAILIGKPDADDDEKTWVPKSLIEDHFGFTVTLKGNDWTEAIAREEEGSIEVPEWWADENGF